MPHGFELECAGVVAGSILLCNGTVTLHLEEIDDRERLVSVIKSGSECAVEVLLLIWTETYCGGDSQGDLSSFMQLNEAQQYRPYGFWSLILLA